MLHDMTPFERHRLDRSHYGEICKRCGYLRCDLCGVECKCPSEVRGMARFIRDALNEAYYLTDPDPEAMERNPVRLNAGRQSLTVVLRQSDGSVKMFRIEVEAI